MSVSWLLLEYYPDLRCPRMLEMLHTILLAAVMFAATNADDLVLLGIFFSRPNSRASDVVLGQLAGIGALTAISYTVSALALSVPHGWLPWLGIVPVLIGIRWFRADRGEDAPESASSAWWSVAGITMANGADNLGVYIPAFALQTGLEKVITGSVFFALTLVWCFVARWAVNHATFAPSISRLLSRIAPFVLIGIGLWIVAQHPLFGISASR